MNPAPPQELPNGFMPAESDEWAEDTVYATRAADELVAGLGLDPAQPWLDRVLVRLDPDQGVWAPVCSAHTVVPFAVVAGHDLTWRGVEFGQVAVPGAIVEVQNASITTCAATAWDVEALAVRGGGPSMSCGCGSRSPSGLGRRCPLAWCSSCRPSGWSSPHPSRSRYTIIGCGFMLPSDELLCVFKLRNGES